MSLQPLWERMPCPAAQLWVACSYPAGAKEGTCATTKKQKATVTWHAAVPKPRQANPSAVAVRIATAAFHEPWRSDKDVHHSATPPLALAAACYVHSPSSLTMPRDPFDLLVEAHGSLLRRFSSAHGCNFQALQQAAPLPKASTLLSIPEERGSSEDDSDLDGYEEPKLLPRL